RQSEYRPLGARAAAPGGAVKVWKIPVCVRPPGGARGGAGDAPVCALLDGPTGTIPLPTAQCPRILHPNADQAGYYRSNVRDADRLALGRLGHDGLTSRERVGLLMDAWAML